jgi:putative hydrolase of the HAD superfamily
VTSPKVIGFDLDGTLFDHEGAARRAVLRFVEERGWSSASDVPPGWAALEIQHFGDHAAGRIDFDEQRRRRMAGLLELLYVDSTGLDLDGLFQEYLPHYRACWEPYPDVVPGLDELEPLGIRFAILTNGEQSQQRAKLQRLGILDRFDVVLAASDLPAYKPSPLAFAAMVEAMGASLDSVVYVGDDLDADVAGAQSAGIKPVWIDRHAAGSGPPGVATISSLEELVAVLE